MPSLTATEVMDLGWVFLACRDFFLHSLPLLAFFEGGSQIKSAGYNKVKQRSHDSYAGFSDGSRGGARVVRPLILSDKRRNY